jgi:hypothetical protein
MDSALKLYINNIPQLTSLEVIQSLLGLYGIVIRSINKSKNKG